MFSICELRGPNIQYLTLIKGLLNKPIPKMSNSARLDYIPSGGNGIEGIY
jgi:hypothetical protein